MVADDISDFMALSMSPTSDIKSWSKMASTILSYIYPKQSHYITVQLCHYLERD